MLSLGLVNVSLTPSMHRFFQWKNSLDVANTSCFLSQIFPFSLSFVLFTRAPADLCCLRGGAELPTEAGRCLWWKECCVG